MVELTQTGYFWAVEAGKGKKSRGPSAWYAAYERTPNPADRRRAQLSRLAGQFRVGILGRAERKA